MVTVPNPINTRIVLAFHALAGWPAPLPPGENTASLGRLPLVIADTRFASPATIVARRIVQRFGRDVVVIEAELRGRRPQIVITVARAGPGAAPAHSAYIPWLDRDGRALWLVSAFTPHPDDVALYRLDADGLHEEAGAPWRHEAERDLGARHAEIVFSRLLGALG